VNKINLRCNDFVVGIG